MIYLKLFLEFFKIGAFSFGGGFSTLPYIYEMARRTSWISVDNLDNILSFSQITPGPFSSNIGTIIGFRKAGIIGAFFCNIGLIIPAIVFMGICYRFFNKIKDNEKISQIIKIIRCAAFAGIISSSITLFKNAFLKRDYNLNFRNFIFSKLVDILGVINFKAIVLGIAIYFVMKKKKVNSLVLISCCSIIAMILKI